MPTRHKFSGKRFLEWVEPIKDSLYRYARRAAWRGEDIDDVVQEAFMTAWQKLPGFEPGTNFRAWMFQILVNKVYQRNKQVRRRREIGWDDATVDLDATLAKENAWATLLDDQDKLMQLMDERLVRSLNRLRPAERQCLLLKLLEGFTYKEIASMLGIPLGTVMSHVHRARMALRESLALFAVERRLIREEGQ